MRSEWTTENEHFITLLEIFKPLKKYPSSTRWARRHYSFFLFPTQDYLLCYIYIHYWSLPHIEAYHNFQQNILHSFLFYISAVYMNSNSMIKVSNILVRAACMRCHGTKCPLLTAFFFFSFSLSSSSEVVTFLPEGVIIWFPNFCMGF